MAGKRARWLGACGVGILAASCHRPLLTDESFGADAGADAADDAAETEGDGATGAARPAEPREPDASEGGGAESTGAAEESCHPSYDPCLPIVDDLNCPDVVELGAAPVTVIGPDEYGLDADNDGIGCEN